MVLIKNWFVLLIIFVVMALVIFQRFRIIEWCNVNRFQRRLPFVAIDFICAYDLMWQVNIQDNFISQNLFNFTYNLNGPFCSNIFEEDICLTPLKIKNRFLFYELKCPTCGYTFDDYSSTGLLGCPDCYDTFEDRLDNIFLKMHGKNRHIKLSNKKRISNAKSIQKDKIDKLDEVASLKNELKTLVENEEYEKAAVVRDKIKKIEKSKRK